MADSVAQTPLSERTGQRFAASLAILVAAIAFASLIGHAVGLASLVQLRPDWQAMSVSTALLCLMLVAALVTDAVDHRAPARIIGTAAVGVSVVIMVGQLLTGHDVLTPWMALLSHWQLQGETSFATAFCALLLGIACLTRPSAQPGSWLTVVVMLVSSLAVLGYAYGVEDLYALSPFRTMSLLTAFAIFSLGLGFLLSNKASGVAALVLARGATGRTTRRQLAFLVLPPLLAYGLMRTTSAHRLGPGAAMALLVVLTVAPLVALVLRDARTLVGLDIERENKRRADKAKLTMERRYRTLFNRLETGFCVIEVKFAEGKPVDYRFLEVNPAFAIQTGVSDAVGKSIRELTPGVEPYRLQFYGRVASTGRPDRMEYEAADLCRHFDVSAFQIDEPDAHHVAVLITDITARKRSELDMKALNETLERRVKERATELEQTQDALRQSQKLEAIGQLTGGVAHDFNNLLTVIQGSVELLRRPQLAEERRKRFTDAIGEAAGRAAKLTNQLLAFARRQSLRPETFDIGEGLRDAMGILGSLTGSGVALHLKVPDDPCFVHADRSQFDAAIVNIVVNARDAMQGEGRIVIAAEPVSGIPALRTHPPVAGDFMAVTIKDTGMGIAPDQLVRIFEPFFTTKDIGSGTGLGLSQVIGFAKQSGGDVRVDSKPGSGATFILYLPREYAGPMPMRQAAEESGDVEGGSVRVLVVEDNAQVGEFAVQSLEELGYQTELARDADEALRLLVANRDRYDIVFSDVIMPGRTGLELGQDLRRLYPDLPVVLTSGYSHVLSESGTAGFELLHKPYSIEQLSRILRKTLAWSKATRNELVAKKIA